jgi:hypothetical protein
MGEEKKPGSTLDRVICFICIPWLILGAIALPSTVEKNRITVLIAMIAIPAALGTVFGIRLVRTKGLGSRLAGGCALVFFGAVVLAMLALGLRALLK